MRFARRVLTGAAAAVLAVVVPVLPAAAHVTVSGEGARPGAQDVVLQFRVPNERSDARTVKVAVTFPDRTPIASVIPKVTPGWTVSTKKVTFATPIRTDDGDLSEGVGEVVFTATGGGIPDGAFETFEVLAGPLPSGVTSLAFPTVQTYSNGSTSSWIEPTVAGTEPAHPAPVLSLVRGGGPGTGTGAAVVVDAAGQGGATAEVATPGPSSSEVRTARLIALIGVGTGVVGLLVAALALGRSRRAAAVVEVPAPDSPAAADR